MYYALEQDELRSYCRKCIESLEHWARRLIHEQLSAKYGQGYVDAFNANGNSIIKKEMRERVKALMSNNPQRFARFVDALFLDDIVCIMCKEINYKELFKDAFGVSYQSNAEARKYLSAIIPVRNALSHSNPISVRQAEQAICYSNDFIDGLKDYYKQKGMERMWNVPSIIKATDSLGNVFFPENISALRTIKVKNGIFRVGETYSITIEVDPSFDPSTYTINWSGNGLKKTDALTFQKTFEIKDVSECTRIAVQVASKKEWHKHGSYDDSIAFLLTVLPPVT